MSEDFEVPKLSDREIRTYADEAKREYRTQRRRPVNIVRCLQSGWIPTRFGRKKLTYNVVDDEEMGLRDARTEFAKGEVIITVKKSIHEKAQWGDGRSRMTLAHELAHGVIHNGGTLYRGSGDSGTTELSRTNAAASAEHQAKVFASAFLIHDEDATHLNSAREISTEFVVSLEAAEICFDRLAERARLKEYVREANERFQAEMGPPRQQLNYSEEACPECKNSTRIKISFGLLCLTCGYHESAE